jgi:hypothetical protein
MFLGNPVFPIAFEIEKVAGLIEATLKKKNWRSFDKGEVKLVLTPVYVFYYDAVFPEEGKPKGKAERGRLALNAETAELNKELADSMPADNELVKELPDEYPLVVRKPLFSKAEAEKIALLKTAALIGADRSNVVLTGLKVVYYPMWLAFVTVKEKTYELEISAVTGEIFGEEQVPKREKGFVEITRETLHELKEPGAWIRYSKEIADLAGDKIEGRGEGKPEKLPGFLNVGHSAGIPGFLHEPWLLLSIVLVVILILLATFL